MLPFLENVTRGRGIPRERLEEVGRALPPVRRPVADQRPEPRVPRRAARRPGRGRHRPARLLGQPQLGPLPPRRGRADGRRRRDPGRLLRHQRLLVVVELPAVPREPVRRRRTASRTPRGWTSCATTSTTRASWSRWSTRSSPRWRELPDGVRDGARLVFVTHSIPTSMNDASGPDGGAYVAQHLDVAAVVAERVREETGVAPGARPGLLLAVRRPPRAVAGAGRQRPPRGPRRPRARPPSCWCRSGSSPTTWRSSTTSTPRRSRPRRSSASRSAAPRPRAPTRGSSPMVRDLLLERAAVERGEERRRRAGGRRRSARSGTAARSGCCANPRGERARDRRRVSVTDARRRAGRPGPRRRPRRRRAGPRTGPTRACPWRTPSPATSTSSPRPTGPPRP